MQFSSLFNGLARNMSIKNGKKGRSDGGKEAADALAKEAKKNDLLLTCSGNVKATWSNNYASAYSKRGQKGMNQDSLVVWEVKMMIKVQFSVCVCVCAMYVSTDHKFV